MRPSGRTQNQLREVTIETGISDYAEGSCMIQCGRTQVLCTATLDERVPPFLRNTGTGWITAEYGMLPRSTHTRMAREASRGKQSGRTVEIQRLIGRSLRAVVDMKLLGEQQIIIDCDVINADGGTRTTSITGGYVALCLALKRLEAQGLLRKSPLIDQVAAISCGIYRGEPVLDLEYEEDSMAEADANFVLTGKGNIVEVQGTAEGAPFSEGKFLELMALAKKGTSELFAIQNTALGR